MSEPLIDVRHVSKTFGAAKTPLLTRLTFGRPPVRVRALDDVSIQLRRGEVLGLVGESGCGKSTLARVVAGLIPADSGEVRMNGDTLAMLPAPERDMRLRQTQMVFQNPLSALNPRIRIGRQIIEAPLAHGLIRREESADFLAKGLLQVGLDPAVRNRFPHEFSGGQLARIGIARALAMQPKVLICDEATAALDVSIQAQLINLLMGLRERLNLSFLFVSHDLGVIRHLSDRVAVMYLGRIVEQGDTAQVFSRPAHPYTQALFEEIPRIHRERRRFAPIKGEIASAINPPSGCHFHPRCPAAMPVCRATAPEQAKVPNGQTARCHLNAA